MRRLYRHKQFKKDFAKVRLSDPHMEKLFLYVGSLLEEKSLPHESRDHALTGEWSDFREFHLGGDVLVIYKLEQSSICLSRIGSHAQLFKAM